MLEALLVLFTILILLTGYHLSKKYPQPYFRIGAALFLIVFVWTLGGPNHWPKVLITAIALSMLWTVWKERRVVLREER